MSERTVSGLEELFANLDRLKDKVAKQSLRLATRKAGQIIEQEAESRAPHGARPHKTYKGRKVAPGFLSRNVNLRVRMDRRKGAIVASVGPSKEAFYGSQFVEVGVPSRGIPARPWLRPALEAKRTEVEDTLVRELRAAVARAIKRGAVR